VTEELYRRFSRERLYEQVADHVEELISDGRLQAGDQLPGERDLTEKLGVARGVVREAMKVLAARGLITVEPGRGTFVVELGAGSVSDHLGRYLRIGKPSHNDLNEFRRVLEVEIAYLAAQRIEAEDLAELQQAIEAMDRHITSPEEYIEADQDFHLILARATHNSLFPLLIDVISDLMQESRRLIFQVSGAPQRGQDCHRQIYEALIRHDPLAAREAMCSHMGQVAEDAQQANQIVK
jgi:GntR family transcriptional repressor for pyruvate dehydrogenase complex